MQEMPTCQCQIAENLRIPRKRDIRDRKHFVQGSSKSDWLPEELQYWIMYIVSAIIIPKW